MGLNDTPGSERTHIGFFGSTNAGKSSLVNAVTDQDLAIVSEIKGTTTDPVTKSMEILPLGPVVVIDTPGFDDDSALGNARMAKAKQCLNKTDIDVLVIDEDLGKTALDNELEALVKSKNIPYIICHNKCDKVSDIKEIPGEIYVSTLTGKGINELKEAIGRLGSENSTEKHLVADLINPGDNLVLVIPIDESAPKGRIILPQQQMIRDILDSNATCVCCQPEELAGVISSFKNPPRMVITDSQAFSEVAAATPKEIPLTSFSILLARYKGFLETAVKGATAIKTLKDGDIILMAEGCTHHRQCQDIGTVKIPNLLRKVTGKNLTFETVSGTEYPDEETLSKYAMVIHCGACMTTEREVTYRMKCTVDACIPFTNYGITLAYLKGILPRSIELFPDLHKLL